jgi:phenylalanine-4-hydroxylase
MEKQYYSNLNGCLWHGSRKKSCIGFSGPADANSFDLITNMPSSTTIKAQHSAERDNLEVYINQLEWSRVKRYLSIIARNFETLKQNHPKDWLLSVEIAEL